VRIFFFAVNGLFLKLLLLSLIPRISFGGSSNAELIDIKRFRVTYFFPSGISFDDHLLKATTFLTVGEFKL